MGIFRIVHIDMRVVWCQCQRVGGGALGTSWSCWKTNECGGGLVQWAVASKKDCLKKKQHLQWETTIFKCKTLFRVGFHIPKQKLEKYVPGKPWRWNICEIYVHLRFFPFLHTAQGWGWRYLWNIICLGPSLPLFILYVTGKQCPCLQLSFPLHILC